MRASWFDFTVESPATAIPWRQLIADGLQTLEACPALCCGFVASAVTSPGALCGQALLELKTKMIAPYPDLLRERASEVVLHRLLRLAVSESLGSDREASGFHCLTSAPAGCCSRLATEGKNLATSFSGDQAGGSL